MNHITVVAHGQEGSFIRAVQHHPDIAVDMARYCRQRLDELEVAAAEGPLTGAQLSEIAWVRYIVARVDRMAATSPIARIDHAPAATRDASPLVMLGQGTSRVTYTPCSRCHAAMAHAPDLYCVNCMRGTRLDAIG